MHLNVGKTKELSIHDSTPSEDFLSVYLNNQSIESVSEFKYLGTYFDDRLSFEANVDHIVRKAYQRMHLLRTLATFHVNPHILATVYKSLVESVLMFNCTAWFGNLTVKNKSRLTRIANQAGRVIGMKQPSLDDQFMLACSRKASSIISDPAHPLFKKFKLLQSGRRYDH